MKYIINGAYYNWINHSKNRWFYSWSFWTSNKRLASGGNTPKREKKTK